LKYLFSLLSLTLLTVQCQQAQQRTETPLTAAAPAKPVSLIDSTRYRAEIYRLDTLFEKLYAANAINGNVLVAKHGHIIYQKCFGFADKASGQQLCDSSLFQLASVSKIFTATAALILYEQGKLKLDENVSEILAGFPYPQVTVKELLAHRSGLPNYTYFCSEYLKDDTATITNNSLLAIINRFQPALYFNPGKRFNYSNTNYALLALIVEKRSGQPFDAFLQQHIFIPAGMRHTTTASNAGTMRALFTKGYTASFQEIYNDRFDGVLGDKGVYSTPYDLYLFSEALYNNKLLKPETQALAYAPNSPERKLSNYGFGWRMKNFNTPDKEVFHNGWWHGYRSSFHRRLRDSLTVVVLSNRLNRSVYATWRILQAVDGVSKTTKAGEEGEE